MLAKQKPGPPFGRNAMNLLIFAPLASAVITVACLLSGAQSLAQSAYVTNFESNYVSVIDTTTNAVIAAIPVGADPNSLTGTPDGSTVYVANKLTNNISRIATASNTVTATIHVGFAPVGIAVTPDGNTVYVANFQSNNVSVINTATNTVTATIPVGGGGGVAVTPDGSKVYVASQSLTGIVSVIATATNTVTATIPVGTDPIGVFIPPLLMVSPSDVATTASGLAFSRVSRTFNGTVTITNISTSPVSGPFQILFSALTPGVTLADATGTFSGSPYLTVAFVGGSSGLAPGQSARVGVRFTNPSFSPIDFTPIVYSGSL